jgi:hypothetical protein
MRNAQILLLAIAMSKVHDNLTLFFLFITQVGLRDDFYQSKFSRGKKALAFYITKKLFLPEKNCW